MAEQVVAGSCNCGGVRFELTGTLHGIFVCHCSICRRWTGSSGVPIVVVDRQGFSWTQGSELVSRWNKPGHDWMSAFCRVCGSSLPVDDDASRMAVPAGLLGDDAPDLQVTDHIWVDSRARWDVIADDGKRHSGPYQS